MTAAVLALGYLGRHLFIDDALIYARYIRNALSGHGLVFNAGERVNALSSPLFSYLVLGLSVLMAGKVLLATAIVSTAFLLAACILAETVFPFAGLLVAGSAYFYLCVGMETSMFLFMLLLVAVLTVREQYKWLPMACALLLLTRFEGAAMVAAVALEFYRRRHWPGLVSFLPAAVVLLLYVALNHFWYGSWLPTSAAAKLGQGHSGIWANWPYAFFKTAYQLKRDFLAEIEVVLLVVVLAPAGLWLLRRTALARLVLVAMGILLALYVLGNIPGYKWYYAPFIFFAMVFAASVFQRSPRWQWLALPVIAAAVASSAWHLHHLAATLTPPGMGYSGVSAWMEANARGASLESAEIGELGWECPDCRMIDILGLTTPKNADHIAHRDMTSWLAEDRPDFVVVHLGGFVYENAPKISPDYVRVPVDFGHDGDFCYLLERKSSTSAPAR